MVKDDLTQVKNIGFSRMKLLNSAGITTIKQLHETSLEKLAEIKNIGLYYAKLIKNSAAECYAEKQKELPKDTKPKEDKQIKKTNLNLQKKLQTLKKALSRVDENLKPLWKKKYLRLYISFKKRSNNLIAAAEKIDQKVDDLPKKVNKKIIKDINSLNIFLKGIGKQPKKKKYQKIIKKIGSFSKMMQGIKT
jgi:hypothetical protein